MTRCWIVTLVIALLLPVAAAARIRASFSKETVKLPEGINYLYQRSPAQEADLRLPLYVWEGMTESFVYTQRDSREHDILRYSRVSLITADPLATVAAFYRTALAAEVCEATDEARGTVTMTAGDEHDIRLVTIAPDPGGVRLTLERTQRFTPPPRVYTAREQEVLRVLGEIAARYRNAPRVAYVMEQWVEPDAGKPIEKTLRWEVDFTRPKMLTLAASTDGTPALSIATRGDELMVMPQVGKVTTRPLPQDGLMLEQLPELDEDPVTRLMLGKNLAEYADYLGMAVAPGKAEYEQGIIKLIFPQHDAEVSLLFDIPLRTIYRADIIVGGEHPTHMVRKYSNLSLTLAPQTPSPPDGGGMVPAHDSR